MKRILFLSLLFGCAFFCGQTAMAQTTAKACTPDQVAACAKVCSSTKARTAAIGLTPLAVQVAQTVTGKGPVDCNITNCAPADCPLICQLLCPIICGSSATQAAASVKTASCTPKPACNAAKKAKTQMASIE